MDLRRFITLKTVVEEGSFLRASQKLCCTQSTVTFHIQQLEREFSLQLFEKIGRRMCLTNEGKKLIPHIHELTRVMESIREAARQDAEPGGELRVATGETLLAYKMPQVLQRFKLRAPNVRLSLQSLNCYVIRDALLNDEVDLGVFYRVGNDDALTMQQLGEQPLALVASPLLQNADFTQPDQHIPAASSSMNRNVSSASYLKVRYGRGGLRWKTPLNCGVLKALNSVWLLTWASAFYRDLPLNENLAPVS